MGGPEDDFGIGPTGSGRVGTIGQVEGAQSAQAADTVESVETTSFDAEIAAAVAAGELTPAQAQALIIDHIVGEQLAPDASPELRESLRAEVAALLEGDPVLEELLRV